MARLLSLIFALHLIFLPSARAVEYQVTDLGVIGIAQSSYARAINDRGEVVGDLDYGGSFIWDAVNGMRHLDNPYGSSMAYAINNHSQVVGDKVYSDHRYRATLWENGSSRDLGAIYLYSSAYDINESGQAVGWTRDPHFSEHACLWDPVSGMQDLGTLAGSSSIYAYSNAYDINEAGQVVGMSDTSVPFTPSRPFIWDETNGMREIVELSRVTAINDQGVIAGTSLAGRAALWSEAGGLQELSFPNGWQCSGITGINNNGQLLCRVTYTLNWGGTGSCWIIWEAGNTQILPETYAAYYSTLTGFNNHGQVVGYKFYGYDMYDREITHATLWQPVPEPSSIIALGSGILALAGMIRRKRHG